MPSIVDVPDQDRTHVSIQAKYASKLGSQRRTSTEFVENDKRVHGRPSEYVRGLLEFDHETISGPRWNQPLLSEKPSAGSKDLRGSVPSQVVGSYGLLANR